MLQQCFLNVFRQKLLLTAEYQLAKSLFISCRGQYFCKSEGQIYKAHHCNAPCKLIFMLLILNAYMLL